MGRPRDCRRGWGKKTSRRILVDKSWCCQHSPTSTYKKAVAIILWIRLSSFQYDSLGRRCRSRQRCNNRTTGISDECSRTTDPQVLLSYTFKLRHTLYERENAKAKMPTKRVDSRNQMVSKMKVEPCNQYIETSLCCLVFVVNLGRSSLWSSGVGHIIMKRMRFWDFWRHPSSGPWWYLMMVVAMTVTTMPFMVRGLEYSVWRAWMWSLGPMSWRHVQGDWRRLYWVLF